MKKCTKCNAPAWEIFDLCLDCFKQKLDTDEEFHQQILLALYPDGYSCCMMCGRYFDRTQDCPKCYGELK